MTIIHVKTKSSLNPFIDDRFYLRSEGRGCAHCRKILVDSYLYNDIRGEIYCNHQCLKGANGLCMVIGCEKTADYSLVLQTTSSLTLRRYPTPHGKYRHYILNANFCCDHLIDVVEIENVTKTIANAIDGKHDGIIMFRRLP